MHALLANNINLLVYHLPLDLHMKFGNNVQLAQALRLRVTGVLPTCGVVCAEDPRTLEQLIHDVTTVLNRTPIVVGKLDIFAVKIAICTGSGQNYITHAAEQGANVFISGEISERTMHLAKEMNMAYIGAGHHATERLGVLSLGEHLAQNFGLEHIFIDIDNPA